MTEDFLKAAGLDREESLSDSVVPFAVEGLDVRGRSVKMDDALNTILTRHDYPTPVARLLGEAIVLAALVGSSLKFEGRFILQTQTDGPVNMIVVDLQTPNGLRGYARFDEVALSEAAENGELSPEQLLGKGILAMTIDQGEMTERYQGIVQLDGDGLEEVAHRYFMQSEQIPTKVRLAVAQFSERAKLRISGVRVAFCCNICPSMANVPWLTCRVMGILITLKPRTPSLSRKTIGLRPVPCWKLSMITNWSIPKFRPSDCCSAFITKPASAYLNRWFWKKNVAATPTKSKPCWSSFPTTISTPWLSMAILKWCVNFAQRLTTLTPHQFRKD